MTEARHIVGSTRVLAALLAAGALAWPDGRADARETGPATAWERMSLDEKIESLAAASVKVGDSGEVASTVYADSDTLWTCLAAFLVFFMPASLWWRPASPGRRTPATSS